MQWLSQHATEISAVGSAGMLFVWIVYAHVFYTNLRRQHRPRIIIDCMSGPGSGSVCAVTNLSSETIYIECVIGVAVSQDAEAAAVVTERGSIASSSQGEREIVSHMRQGPLASGALVTIGTIEEIAECAVSRAKDPERALATLKALEVRVVATMSAEDRPIGAWKRFSVGASAGMFRAEHLETVQMCSRTERRRVLGWLERL